MDKHVEDRFERVEKNLGEMRREFREDMDAVGKHLRFASQILQDANTLARENQKTLQSLIGGQGNIANSKGETWDNIGLD